MGSSSDRGQNASSVTELLTKASRVLAQSTPSHYCYLEIQERWVCLKDGGIQELPLIGEKDTQWVLPSGDLFIHGDSQQTQDLSIYLGPKKLHSLSVGGIAYCQVAEWQDGTLLLGGFSRESQPILRAYHADGRLLRERVLPLVDRTAGLDRGMMFSFFKEGKWHLWVPSMMEILIYDKSLALLSTSPLDLPRELTQTPNGFSYLLHTHRSNADRLLELCRQKAGQTISVFPKGLFSVDNGVALAFFQVDLKGCHAEQTGDLSKFLDFAAGTRLIYLEDLTFERTPERDSFLPDVTARGYFGNAATVLVENRTNFADPNSKLMLRVVTLNP